MDFQRGLATALKSLKLHTPTILNSAYSEALFWDGRAGSLEEQALGPIKLAAEMNMPLGRAVERVSSLPGYKTLFARAYPGERICEETIAKAIATFERIVVSAEAPFNLWIGSDQQAISEPAKRDFDLINHKAGCAQCHSGWNFTDSGFHDIGTSDDDRGRGALLKLEAMQHAFKTPTLRNGTLRAPYMHDGSEQSLGAVIDFHDEGGKVQRASLAPEIHSLHLTAGEKSDLIEFVRMLTTIALATLALADDHKVTQKDRSFSQNEITIKPGDKLVFQNADDITPNVFSLSSGMEFDLRRQAPGATSTVRLIKKVWRKSGARSILR